MIRIRENAYRKRGLSEASAAGCLRRVRFFVFRFSVASADGTGGDSGIRDVDVGGHQIEAAGGDGCVGQRALASGPGAELEYEDYFQRFFADNGEYRKYVSLVVGTEEILKVGKEYKVGVVVSVQKDELRKALEAAGVIKGLNYGF